MKTLCKGLQFKPGVNWHTKNTIKILHLEILKKNFKWRIILIKAIFYCNISRQEVLVTLFFRLKVNCIAGRIPRCLFLRIAVAVVPPVAQWIDRWLQWFGGCVEAAHQPTSSWSDRRTRDGDQAEDDELPSTSNQIQMSSKNARRAGHFSQHRVTR